MEFNVTLGTQLPSTMENADHIMDGLARFSVTAHEPSTTPGLFAATITIPAASLEDAIQIALLSAKAADLGEITTLEVLSTEAFDQAAEQASTNGGIPDLVSITTAAAMLGISRTAARKRIGKSLQGTFVDGPGWVVTRTSVDAAVFAKNQQDQA
ncbi:hypothetical protein [Luteococcus sp.]|uniref:hypothetical protein n=1 Tax=Luteococcus sp. TaxID=1969402 RepID=UPI003736B5B8